MGGRKPAFFVTSKIGVFQRNILNSCILKMSKTNLLKCCSFTAVSYELHKFKVHRAVCTSDNRVTSPKVPVLISTINTVTSLDDGSIYQANTQVDY